MKNFIISVCLLVFVSGCATQPTVATLPTSRTFKASKDQIWPILVAEIAPKYPTRVVQKDSGLISTDMVSVPVGVFNMGAWNYARQPSMFLATWNGLRMSLTAMVSETQNGQSTVSISIHYEAFEDNVSKSWIICQTTGQVEAKILDAVEGKLPH
jgi:hypothetical protein